jgi:hypothetical protein
MKIYAPACVAFSPVLIIVYRVEADDVVILLVVRGDRDIAALLPEDI